VKSKYFLIIFFLPVSWVYPVGVLDVRGTGGRGSPLRCDFDVAFDFNILTALKGWVGHAPQGRDALQNR